MQLKLLPPHPLPTVLFTLAYPAPPPSLPLPASYAALLKRVVEDRLLDAEHSILERVDGPLPFSSPTHCSPSHSSHSSHSHCSSAHSSHSAHSHSSSAHSGHAGVSPALRSLGSPTSPGQGVNGGQGSLTPHALDRATWIAAVLSEVVFDLSDGTNGSEPPSPAEQHPDPHHPEHQRPDHQPTDRLAAPAGPRRVRVLCRYVDGREVSWVWEAPAGDDSEGEDGEDGGEAAACYAALQSVLRDVTDSAAAGERERRDRERRHVYAERYAFAPAHGACGGFERYDRYPAPGLEGSEVKDLERREGEGKKDAKDGKDGKEAKDGKERKRHSTPLAPMQRSSSCEEVRARAAPGRRRSLDDAFARDAQAHVPGAVETRRGKARRRQPPEDDGEKKKHKKRGSFMMGLVALASFISPRSTRARSPPRPPSPRPAPSPDTAHSAPGSRSPSPSPPHVVHPQLALEPHRDPPLSSSDLRRRARATLVDVFRRHVLAQLKTPHALPPRVPTREPRRVRSTGADSFRDFSAGTLRSGGSALTARSSDASLSGASTRVHCVSRSPSGGFRDIVRGADAHALHARLAAGAHSDHDGDHDGDHNSDGDEDDAHPFGRANEGGYVTWVARSLLTRVDAEMREMRVVLRTLHARAPAPAARGARVGFSPVDGPLLAPLSVSPPVAGLAGVVGEWGAGVPTLVDEPAPFFEGFDEEQLEDVPLEDEAAEDDAEDRTSTGASSSSASTETDGSSVHTPSEATSFDGACIRAPATPPLVEPERGEYFNGVQDQSAEFDAAPLASSPPRRPVLTKQPPIHAVKETHPPPLPSQLAQGQPPVYRPVLPPLSTGSVLRSLTPSPSSALSSPDLSQSSPTPSTLPIAAYTALSGERARLLGILARLASQHAAAQADEHQLLTVLEAKSRRRAWSNRAFMGGASMRLCALATPARRSALATAKVISLADVAAAAAPELEGVSGVQKKRGSLVVTTAENNILRLFPVCEEDEDSGSDDDGAADASFLDRSFRAGAFATASFPGAYPDAALEGRAQPGGAQPAHASHASAYAAAARARAAPPHEEPAREDAALGPLDPAAAPGRRPADAELASASPAANVFPDTADTYTTMDTPLVRHRRTSVPVRARTRTRSMSAGGAVASTSTNTSSDEASFVPSPMPLGLAPALPLLPPLSASYPGAHAPLPPLLGPNTTVPYMLHGSRRVSTADLLADGAEEDASWSAALEPQTKVELFDVYSGDEDEDEEEGARMDEVDDEFLLGVDIAGPAELPSFCRPRVGAEGWMPAAHL
ncbi:hypothetical protein PsYK624_128760 [Phanerochaete sordida]|uniref:Uncharacterized protein n=1 Tax=Phanerochaete sordida TaxID=48140 RepID=A0A9P3GLZ4_9APHY|nr:hypothetical protein PsYK624_128760 [Phanerochaete sordida]